MPRGMYNRKKTKKSKAAKRKIFRQFLRKSTKPQTRTFGGVKQHITDEGEFLTAGTTHTREKLSRVDQLESEYDELLYHANGLADFILANVPYKGTENIPANIVESYLHVRKLKLTHHQ